MIFGKDRDEMSEPDLVQQGIQQARYSETVKSVRFLINTAWLAIVSTPNPLGADLVASVVSLDCEAARRVRLGVPRWRCLA